MENEEQLDQAVNNLLLEFMPDESTVAELRSAKDTILLAFMGSPRAYRPKAEQE